MKIRREDFPDDPCIKSMSFLKQRIEAFFKGNVAQSSQRYYPELDIYTNQRFDSKEILDVVLFGNNVKSFFQSSLWPGRNYRIWTLSKPHQDFWTSTLFDHRIETPINLIPRSLLTAEEPKEIPSSFKEQAIDLVFAGRLSAQKNITYLLLLYKELELLDLKVSLHLYGKFDDQYDEIFGRRRHENYKDTVINLIQKLDFSTPPVINENLGENEWTETNLNNPVLISLSTYHCEDFGVSVTQAQEKGWPLILTDMLGHKCINHANLIKIPSRYHLREHLPLDIKRIFAKDLARFLSLSTFVKSKCSTSSLTTTQVSDIDLLKARKSLIQKMGTQLSLINAESVALFYDTQVGITFHLDFIHEIYSDVELSVFIVEDADHKGVPHNIQTKLLDLLENENFYPYFISLKHLFKSKVELDLLAKAKRVVLLLDSSIQETTRSKLIETFGFSQSLFY